MLDKLQAAVDELQADSSSNNKVETLKRCLADEFVRRVFFYVYHPLYQFHVTSSVCKKNMSLTGRLYPSLFELLDDLRLRRVTGHEAVGCVNAFVSNNPGHEKLILSVIDKDLKTRTGDKIINKAVPGLIPEFEVALSEKFDEKHVDFRDDWYASRKLDGVRCLILVEDGKVSCVSRQGKVFKTLGVVEQEVAKLGFKDVVFDCEVCLLDGDTENFQGIMRLIMKKDFTIPNPSCRLFDMLTMEEFSSKKSKRVFSERLAALNDAIPCDNPVLKVLPQTVVKDKTEYDRFMAEAVEKGWEGLILRKDTTYQGKRSKDLLKCKNFLDDEYEVVTAEMGPFRYVLDGRECEEEMLSYVTINHKGHKVRVGSGWGIAQRQHYYKNPGEIVGKTIKVQYFEETFNQQGEISLRFPTVKIVYEEGRDT